MPVTSTSLDFINNYVDVRDYVVETKNERKGERYDLRMTKRMKGDLHEIASRYGVDVSDVIRAAVDFCLKGPPSPAMDIPSVSAMLAEAAQSGELQEALSSGGLRLPVIGEAPCGPLREVVASTNIFHFLSPATAEWLEARPNDYLIVCDGESMEMAGIPDGALLLLRPLPKGGRPQSGEVALVQFEHEDGAYTSTIKRWVRSEPLVLENGEGEPIEIPTDLKQAIPVAVARGLVSRYK